MKDDLLDAQASVDWAEYQIVAFQEKVAEWNASRPFEIRVETDAPGVQALVAYSMGELDPIVNAEVGVIINSIRTALDLLASSLARRNNSKVDVRNNRNVYRQ